MTAATPTFGYTNRASAAGVAIALVAALVAFLDYLSRTVVPTMPGRTLQAVSIRTEQKATRSKGRAPLQQSSNGAVAITDIPVGEQSAPLPEILACLNFDPAFIDKRPAWCPPPKRPKRAEFWERPANAPPHQIALDDLMTRYQQKTIHPPCETGNWQICVRSRRGGKDPTRTPQQICEEANMGGPCAPPPFRDPRQPDGARE